MTHTDKHHESDDAERARIEDRRTKDANPSLTVDDNADPISGAPGAHPVGTGAGAAGLGTAGGVIGASLGGPVGFAVGAVVGAVAGGLMGKGVAEQLNPTLEDAYWREHYPARPYFVAETPYDSYQPAYAYGWESRDRHATRQWEEIEAELQADWERSHTATAMPWIVARPAVRDAWDRLER
jgi:hypothetical protein